MARAKKEYYRENSTGQEFYIRCREGRFVYLDGIGDDVRMITENQLRHHWQPINEKDVSLELQRGVYMRHKNHVDRDNIARQRATVRLERERDEERISGKDD